VVATLADRRAQSDAIGEQRQAAVTTARETQLAPRVQCSGEQDCVLEADFPRGQQCAVGLVRVADQIARQRLAAALFVSTRGRSRGRCKRRYGADRGEQRRQSRGVTRGAAGAQKDTRALRRFAAVAAHRRAPFAQVAAVQLADAVIAETGPAADRAGACFEANEPDREIHALGVAGVAVVGDAHGGFP
jgi:hypothetical protein